jgi:rubrerythrin
MRASHTELLWVCGDCGHPYPRSQACPDGCSACGAPREHFYAPVED